MFVDFAKKVNPAYGNEVVRRFIITIIEKYVDMVEMVIKDENSSAEKMILLITEVKKPEKINRALCNKLFELSEFE